MANNEKSGFSGAPMGGPSPQPYPHGYATQANPPPYVTQPQYGNQYAGAPVIVTAQPVRETGPPPDTTCSFIISILSIFFCLGAWPFAVVAIIFNRKAKSQVDMGQYSIAKGTLRTCFIFIGVTVVLGIIAWVIFGIRLKIALDAIEKVKDDDGYRYYG